MCQMFLAIEKQKTRVRHLLFKVLVTWHQVLPWCNKLCLALSSGDTIWTKVPLVSAAGLQSKLELK